MQNDFIGEYMYSDEEVALGASPCSSVLGFAGACFGVPEGSQSADVISDLVNTKTFDFVIASMDDHSPDHCSFFASASDVTPPASCADNFALANCDSTAFHACRGTLFEQGLLNEGDNLVGPFPPHCVRGYVGTELYAPIYDAMVGYTSDKYIAVKGLDTTTDSFGVISYSEKSWDIYQQAGMFSNADPSPAVMIRSMMTWEKNLRNSTGAASYSSLLVNQYTQPPPFGTNGAAGKLLVKKHVDELISSQGDALQSIIVTGLAADWCVLDTAINARALWPDKDVYFVLDALRPAFLPRGPVDMYLKKDSSNQLYNDGAWLHDPADVAALLSAAGVKVILSSQIV